MDGRTMTRTEYGVICDRRFIGAGRLLIATGSTPELAEHRAHESCDLISEHPHLTVTHTVTISEWSKPASSENTGGDS